MTVGTHADVVEHARRRLAFLEDEHGLRRHEEGGSPVTVLQYRDRDVGLEVQLEWREALVYVLVVRLTDGAPPPPTSYYVHEGRRVRRSLYEVVEEAFPADTARLREAVRLREEDRTRRMTRALDIVAEVLRAVAEYVLSRGHEAFDDPAAPGG